MSHKFYLYGAGQNAWHIVKFLGKENIAGIIDSALEVFERVDFDGLFG
ncbi:MAG: hypothetical protein IJU95_09975 [Treponema sp.]|nr:hypothetical protein [Treponema sp.]